VGREKGIGDVNVQKRFNGSILWFPCGNRSGATAVILLGSKRIDQLHDEVIEVINDGVRELRRQAQKTVNTAWRKLDEAIDIGADAYNEAKR
jgi:hypothetical protein